MMNVETMRTLHNIINACSYIVTAMLVMVYLLSRSLCNTRNIDLSNKQLGYMFAVTVAGVLLSSLLSIACIHIKEDIKKQEGLKQSIESHMGKELIDRLRIVSN